MRISPVSQLFLSISSIYYVIDKVAQKAELMRYFPRVGSEFIINSYLLIVKVGQYKFSNVMHRYI